MGWALQSGGESIMFTMFEWMQSLDPVKVEAERFAVYRREPEPVRELQPVTFTPTRRERREKARKDVTRGLDLTPAQQRAVDAWMKGKGK